MTQIVYTDVTDAEGMQGSLFEGTRFWISQKVPQRKRFIDEVKANGGEITPLEKEANVKIVDHARKEQLPGTYSYRYIEVSVRNGALEDLEKHAVGPPAGSVRAVGSTIQPAKSSRTKFTSDDDRILVNWVVGIEQSGGATSGNEIYKQLEAKNSRHTWQSWRDRWVKILKDLPRSAYFSQNAPPTPPAEQTAEANEPPKAARLQRTPPKPLPFAKDDAEDLIKNGEGILNVLPENVDDAWLAWANSRDSPEDHTAKEWQDFWEKSIGPVYLRRKARSAGNPEEGQGMAGPDREEKVHLEQPKSTTLPVRISPSKESTKERSLSRSPSYHPESPIHYSKATKVNKVSVTSIVESVDGACDSRNVTESPSKRKRLASEEVEEVPSSSPPETIRSPKRLRHGVVDSFLNEIEPISQRDRVEHVAREVPDTYATDKHGDIIDLVDCLEDDREISEPLDEEEYYLKNSHSVSPELGRSPTHAFGNVQRDVSKTQIAFDEPVLPIDFGLALPKGGFGDEDEERIYEDHEDSDETEVFHSLEAEEQDEVPPKSYRLPPNPDSDSIPPSSPPVLASLKHNQPTTQAILDAQTQQLDYSLPAPEGGWDADALPSSSQLKLKEQAPSANRSPSPDPAEQLDAFIDHHLSLGYTEDAVHLALKCTSMDPVLSVELLVAMRGNGGTVPREMKGCWTEGDDKDLDSVDARRIRRLEEKHGKGGVEGRWAFLEDYRR